MEFKTDRHRPCDKRDIEDNSCDRSGCAKPITVILGKTRVSGGGGTYFEAQYALCAECAEAYQVEYGRGIERR